MPGSKETKKFRPYETERHDSGPLPIANSDRTMLGNPVTPSFQRAWLSFLAQTNVSATTWESYLGFATVIPPVRHSLVRTLRTAFVAGTLMTAGGFFWYSGGYRAYTEGADDIDHLLNNYCSPSQPTMEAIIWLLTLSTVWGNFIMPLVSIITQSTLYRDNLDRFYGDKLAPSFTPADPPSLWSLSPIEIAKSVGFFIAALASSLMELGIALTPGVIMTSMLYAKVVFVALLRFHLSWMSLWAIEKTITEEKTFYITAAPTESPAEKIKTQLKWYLQEFQARAVFLEARHFDRLAEKKKWQQQFVEKFAPLYDRSDYRTKQSVLDSLAQVADAQASLADIESVPEEDIARWRTYSKLGTDHEQAFNGALGDVMVNSCLTKFSMRMMLSNFTQMLPALNEYDAKVQDQITAALTPNHEIPKWQHILRYTTSLFLLSSSAAGIINGDDGAKIVSAGLGLNPEGILRYTLTFLASLTICTLALKFTIDAGRAPLKSSLPMVSLRANKNLYVMLAVSTFFNFLSFGVSYPAANNAVERFLNGNMTAPADPPPSDSPLPDDSYQYPDQGWGLLFIAWVAVFSVINNIIVTQLGILRVAQLIYELTTTPAACYVKFTNFAKDARAFFGAMPADKLVAELIAWYEVDPIGMQTFLNEAGLMDSFEVINEGHNIKLKEIADPNCAESRNPSVAIPIDIVANRNSGTGSPLLHALARSLPRSVGSYRKVAIETDVEIGNLSNPNSISGSPNRPSSPVDFEKPIVQPVVTETTSLLHAAHEKPKKKSSCVIL